MMALEPNNVPTATSSELSSSLLLLVIGFGILPFIGMTFDTLVVLDDHAPILCK
jgi:hypothetical protein